MTSRTQYCTIDHKELPRPRLPCRTRDPSFSEVLLRHRRKRTRCFWIHRVDGTKDNFSFGKCLDAKYNIASLVSDALRKAVKAQGWEFRDAQFQRGPVVCPYTGERLSHQT